MDFNDIDKRIKRVYMSLEGRSNSDFNKGVVVQKNETANSIEYKIFASTNETDVNLKSIGIIEELAKLKDHLKNYYRSKGKNPQLIEDKIDRTQHLQVL